MLVGGRRRRVVTHDISGDLGNLGGREHGFPWRHLDGLGFVRRSFAYHTEHVHGLVAVFPLLVIQRQAGQGRPAEFGAEVSRVAGGADAGVDGLAFVFDDCVLTPGPEDFVIEGGEHFLQFLVFHFLDGLQLGGDTVMVIAEKAALIIERPIEDKPDDGEVESHQPPVGESLIEFLNAVEDMGAQDGLVAGGPGCLGGRGWGGITHDGKWVRSRPVTGGG